MTAAPYDSYSAVTRRLADHGGPVTAHEKRDALLDIADPDMPDAKADFWGRITLPSLHTRDRMAHVAAIRVHGADIRHLETGGPPVPDLIARKPGEDDDALCTRQLDQARHLLDMAIGHAVLADGHAGRTRRGVRVVAQRRSVWIGTS